MLNITIEPTIRQDISDLRLVLDQTGLFPSDMLADMLEPSLSGLSEALWLTCHVESKAVGLCFTTPEELTDGTWNMRALAVRPDMQGKGLGSRLFAEVEARLKANNQRILIVDTSGSESFALTRKFYDQNGYHAEARIRDFWAVGEDKVTFSKAL